MKCQNNLLLLYNNKTVAIMFKIWNYVNVQYCAKVLGHH